MVERRKLMIVRGAPTSRRPRWKACCCSTPAVASAVVFGVPDDRLGERVAALIVPAGADLAAPDLDAAALGAFCAERLARYKIPEIWGRAGSLPANAMGKIIRTGLTDVLRTSAPL